MEHKKIVVVYGPPGVGKSTLVLLAQSLGVCAYDIEKYGDTFDTRKLGMLSILEKEKSSYVFFGAADMKPGDFPQGTMHILLLPPKVVYVARMKKRDAEFPHKSGQNGMRTYARFAKVKENYDVVFDKEITAQKLLEDILKITNYIK